MENEREVETSGARFQQREGIGFGEIFALTVSGSGIRLLSAITCELLSNLC